MDDAKTALARIDEWRKRIRSAAADVSPAEREVAATGYLQAIDAALADDLNINELLGVLFIWIRSSNKNLDEGSLTKTQAYGFDQAWKTLDAVLGLGDAEASVPPEVQALADRRAAARKAKDFAASDTLRKEIEALGWKVKDTSAGQELRPG
jgi:cysteinyl-tRNA synthetase